MNTGLLPFIHKYQDRHGKPRWYLRRVGQKKVPLPNPDNRAQFMLAYSAAIDTAVAAAIPQKGYIYFVAMGDFVKIGFSTKVKKRVAELQVSSPVKLEILHVHAGTREDEERLHEKFGQHSSNGEWFEKVPELSKFIIRLKAEWRSPIFSSWDDK